MLSLKETEKNQLIGLFVEDIYGDPKTAVEGCFNVPEFPFVNYVEKPELLYEELEKRGVFVKIGDVYIRLRNKWVLNQPVSISSNEQNSLENQPLMEKQSIPANGKEIMPEMSLDSAAELVNVPSGQIDTKGTSMPGKSNIRKVIEFDAEPDKCKKEKMPDHLSKVPKKYKRFAKKAEHAIFTVNTGLPIQRICDTAISILMADKSELRRTVSRKQGGNWSDADILWELEFNWRNGVGKGITDYTVQYLIEGDSHA